MAITTIHAHVNRAKEFFQKEDVYFAIGRPNAWEDELNPPVEDFNASALDGVIGYKKVEQVYLVRPAQEGEPAEIPYREEKWVIVPFDQALLEGARWVYIATNLQYTELPLGFYRQVGVYSGLKKMPEVDVSKFNLLPSEVADPGTLEVFDNRQPSNRQLDQREKLSLIIEF